MELFDLSAFAMTLVTCAVIVALVEVRNARIAPARSRAPRRGPLS